MILVHAWPILQYFAKTIFEDSVPFFEGILYCSELIGKERIAFPKLFPYFSSFCPFFTILFGQIFGIVLFFDCFYYFFVFRAVQFYSVQFFSIRYTRKFQNVENFSAGRGKKQKKNRAAKY